MRRFEVRLTNSGIVRRFVTEDEAGARRLMLRFLRLPAGSPATARAVKFMRVREVNPSATARP